jgi:hypothetical protein
MDKQFDDLSKSLAEGVSRRVALRKLGIGMVGILLAAVGIGSPTRADAQIGRCATDADCGYLSGQACCNGKCVYLNTDQDCGACGRKCRNGLHCKGGACLPRGF